MTSIRTSVTSNDWFLENSTCAVMESTMSVLVSAMWYGAMLDLPFIYSSNGDAFLEHDRTRISGKIESELPLTAFPSPGDLWQRYCQFKGIDPGPESIIQQEYHDDGSGRMPRYYQQIAINRTVEAVDTA